MNGCVPLLALPWNSSRVCRAWKTLHLEGAFIGNCPPYHVVLFLLIVALLEMRHIPVVPMILKIPSRCASKTLHLESALTGNCHPYSVALFLLILKLVAMCLNRVISRGKLGLTAARIASTAFVRVKNHFFAVFVFESEVITM